MWMVRFCRVHRFLWLLIILGFFTLFLFLISTKLKELLSHPKNVDVSVEYKHDLQFPSVTVCNNNKFRYRHSSIIKIRITEEKAYALDSTG